MSRDSLKGSKVFAAVHVMTESCDHYNYLLEVSDSEDLIQQLKDSLGDEFSHICDVYVTMPKGFETRDIEYSIMDQSMKSIEGGED